MFAPFSINNLTKSVSPILIYLIRIGVPSESLELGLSPPATNNFNISGILSE